MEIPHDRDWAVLAPFQTLAPQDLCALLSDTRPLHRRLLAGTAGAGIWRGTPGTELHRMPRVVYIARRRPGIRQADPCAPPEEVARGMETYGEAMALTFAQEPRGHAALDAMAALTVQFFRTHPYADGNGRVLRAALYLLAPRLGLRVHPAWTLLTRPYDTHMSLCLQWYAEHPLLLSSLLGRWFQPCPENLP